MLRAVKKRSLALTSRALTRYASREDRIGRTVRSLSTATFSKLGAWGQFGNQLFQISAVLGYATEYGCRAKLPPWRCAVKGVDYQVIFPRIADYIGRVPGVLYCQPSFAFHKIPFIFNADLRGHFQSERYFQGAAPLVRRIFEEPAPVTARLNEYCASHNLTDFDAIHMRFYSHANDKGYPMEQLPEAYYLSAAREMGARGRLVVATDDKRAFERFSAFHAIRPDIHLLTFDDPILDFYCLSRAQRVAISNSSFSWWAAYLGRKKERVFAPDRYYWFSTRVRHNPFWDTRDLYPGYFDELIW